MTRRTNKQKHLDNAEVIKNYASAFKEWNWLFNRIATATAAIFSDRVIDLITGLIDYIRNMAPP